MASNEVKKMMVFSSVETKNLVDNLVKDESLITGRSNSSIFEEAIISRYLTGNKNIDEYIRLLYGYDDKNISIAIKQTLSAIFQKYAAGHNGKPAYENGKAFVEWVYNDISNLGNGISINKNNEKHIPYFLDKVDTLNKILKKYRNTLEKGIQITEIGLNDNIKLLSAFQKKKTEDIFAYKDNFEFIYETILDYWEVVSESTYTYRLLTIMTEFQTFPITPDARLEIKNIIIENLKEWH